jgi:hypothetical protein
LSLRVAGPGVDYFCEHPRDTSEELCRFKRRGTRKNDFGADNAGGLELMLVEQSQERVSA